MTRNRKLRVYYVLLLLVGAAVIVGLVLYALRQNIDLFYTPTELLKTAPNNRVRIGGMIRAGSINYGPGLQVAFIVTDFENDILVEYSGVLPDLFREEQGVVALGKFSAGKFVADQILAKHDENYMPPDVSRAIDPGFSSPAVAVPG